MRVTPVAATILAVLALAGAAALYAWQRRRAREREVAVAALRKIRPSAARTPSPEELLTTTPVPPARRQRRVVPRHAPYVPDESLPPAVAALPFFGGATRHFARTVLACATEHYDLRVMDYASTPHVDGVEGATVALFHSDALPAALDVRAALARPSVAAVAARLPGLGVERAGDWLLVHRGGASIPDDEMELFVHEARALHDLLVAPEEARVAHEATA